VSSDDRINRGSLLFSTARIELSLNVGEIYEGMFEIKDDSNNHKMEGCVYSSTIRVRPGFERFEGKHIVVPYEVDTAGMQVGDELKGSFSIVSDAGEYVLPFVISIGLDIMDSSIGMIRNLFHFTNLARTNWDEAVRMFMGPGFIDIISDNDSKYRNLYLGLKGRGNKNYNLEEFLVGINKKSKITYSVANDNVKIANPQGIYKDVIELKRSSWGYTQLAVKTDGDFITVDRSRLREEDFENDICRVEYEIDEKKLHSGNNFGSITFRSLYGSVSVYLTVVNNAVIKKTGTSRKRKSVSFSLVRHYMDYATKRISQNKWITLTEELLSHRTGFAQNDLEYALYQTHLLLIQERFNEAKWILDHKITDVIEDAENELYCYYLYLMTIYNADDYYKREACQRITSIYERDPSNWRVAWALLNTNEEFKRNPARAYAFGIRQLKLDCNSPVFYVENIKRLNASPSLLVHFDREERRLLYFAARNHLVDEELQGQIAYQAARARDYDEKTLRTLMYLYESRPDDLTLEAICSQLMRGNLTGSKYYDWYKKGVDRNLRITRLYDFYMLSVDINEAKEVPRDVLMYFSYQSNLPIPQTSFLYAYMEKNRELLPDMYALYRPAIERFVIKQLYAGRINKDLAFLYKDLILKEMATVDNIRAFSKIFLFNCIKIKDDSIVNVIVTDGRLDKEMMYPVNGKTSFVPLLSDDCTLLLEDGLGNRYYQTKEYSSENYFAPRRILSKLEEYTENSLLFNLFVCEGNNELITVNDKNANRYMYLLRSKEISSSYKNAIRMPLIRYYREIDDTIRVDEIIESLEEVNASYEARAAYDPRATYEIQAAYDDRNELILLLLIRGYLDKAFRYVCLFGPETIEPKILVRLCTMYLEREGMIEDYRITGMIFSAFERGKYDETGLQYLCTFYRGLAKNLRDIWKAAGGFYVDAYNLCERMLIQTLDTGAYIGDDEPILKAYIAGGAKSELVHRYLLTTAQDYFERGRITNGYMFREMARIYENERDLPLVCMLAFLKYYATDGNLREADDNIKEHIRRYIRILYARHNIIMPFMTEFKDISHEALEMSDLTMIEYHGEAGSRVVINYQMTREDSGRQGYIREEMVNVYGGVFVKSFLLFFGETLQYYITENNGDSEQLTESGTLSRTDVESDVAVNRFAMVNDIAIASTLKDYDTAENLMLEYKYKEYLVDNLFKML